MSGGKVQLTPVARDRCLVWSFPLDSGCCMHSLTERWVSLRGSARRGGRHRGRWGRLRGPAAKSYCSPSHRDDGGMDARNSDCFIADGCPTRCFIRLSFRGFRGLRFIVFGSWTGERSRIGYQSGRITSPTANWIDGLNSSVRHKRQLFIAKSTTEWSTAEWFSIGYTKLPKRTLCK